MEIHSEEFVGESEKSELSANDSVRNDENESEGKSTIHNETRNLGCIAAAGNDCGDVRAEQCANHLSKDLDGTENTATFKKPTVSVAPKRIRSECKTAKISDASCSSVNKDRSPDSSPPHVPLPYVEPSWGGKPPTVDYKMEILKSGVIVDTVSLVDHSFYVVGRLPSCHLSLAHPTISRYHAILQYRSKASEEGEGHSEGFYVYDLGSTHGTYWNGNRIKPKVYVRVRGGHMLGFGCSQRKYILQAPPEDEEEESPYSLTELKEMRASELKKRMGESRIGECRPVEDEESEGVDWGMGEDADEETDLQENPYACITDEDLVLEDPKKTLRGWFEREGYDLRYQTEEKGLGQFLCWVDLPMEDVVGHSLRAEALVKGKKKEAVVQCALEACKILDKHGLLRQANHEARKRKTRNWEAEDYYDSDEDNFLDRTGSIEKKRTQRMRLAGRLEEKAETYDSLLEKHERVAKRISQLSSSLENWQRTSTNSANEETTEEDALDAFMSNLSSSVLTKSDVAKTKLELQNLRKEEASLVKLLNLTRPANLPPLPLSARDVENETKPREAKSTVDAARETSSEKNGPARPSSFHRRKIMRKKETSRDDKNSETSVVALDAVSGDETARAESIEEMDDDSDDDDRRPTSTDSSDKARFDASASVAPEPRSGGNRERVEEIVTRRREHPVRTTKKPRQKEQEKMCCDQDAYADNYSTWVPPADQAGDGKTSLNEKYGY